jgi:hypothetical protein
VAKEMKVDPLYKTDLEALEIMIDNLVHENNQLKSQYDDVQELFLTLSREFVRRTIKKEEPKPL